MRNERKRSSGFRGVWKAAGFSLLVLSAGTAGCGIIVTQKAYDKDQKKIRSDLQTVRKQMLAHTQVLANHGKAINENRLQIRDAVSDVKKFAAKRAKAAAAVQPPPQAPPAAAPPPPQTRRARAPRMNGDVGRTLVVRGSYRGLPLNYAGGYQEPRGRRYPYKLRPGTRVRVLSGELRGFTRIQVLSGRWKGKRMWVRTIWLIQRKGATIPPAVRGPAPMPA